MKINTAHLEKSETIEKIPLACCDESAAVEFFEEQIWQGKPHCPQCESSKVYQMMDAKTGTRNKRFLWRCHDCKQQFTIRIGTVTQRQSGFFQHCADSD